MNIPAWNDDPEIESLLDFVGNIAAVAIILAVCFIGIPVAWSLL